MDRTYSKDQIILNFNHPMYQRLHVLRTDVAMILPSAHVFNRSAFHITIDGAVEFQAVEDTYRQLAWPKRDMLRYFRLFKRYGAYNTDAVLGWSGYPIREYRYTLST